MANAKKSASKPETISLDSSSEDEISKLNPAIEFVEPDLEFDLKNRDPRSINDHVKVNFLEIFAEPDENYHSFDKVWQISYKLFNVTKLWTYRIISVVLAIPLAILWGLVFACLAFCNNWCIQPGLKCFTIKLFPARKSWSIIVETMCLPCFKAAGAAFSKIKIHTSRN